MAERQLVYDRPDRFVAGTVGEPGDRTFYVQVRQGNRLTSVVVEKEQVKAIAEHLDTALEELARIADDTLVPPRQERARDNAPLETPIYAEFRVGSISIGWDGSEECFALELSSVIDPPDTTDVNELIEALANTEPEEALIVRISPRMAREFVPRCLALVRAGRPACPFCQQPMEAGGHICPRSNGYRRWGGE